MGLRSCSERWLQLRSLCHHKSIISEMFMSGFSSVEAWTPLLSFVAFFGMTLKSDRTSSCCMVTWSNKRIAQESQSLCDEAAGLVGLAISALNKCSAVSVPWAWMGVGEGVGARARGRGRACGCGRCGRGYGRMGMLGWLSGWLGGWLGGSLGEWLGDLLLIRLFFTLGSREHIATFRSFSQAVGGTRRAGPLGGSRGAQASQRGHIHTRSSKARPGGERVETVVST